MLRQFTSALKKFLCAFALTCLFGLSACSSSLSVGLKESEVRTIERGEMALVLFRLVVESNDAGISPFQNTFYLDNFGIGAGSFKTGGHVEQQLARFPSEAFRRAGWAYLTLEPGYIYLSFLPPQDTDQITYLEKFDLAPKWRALLSRDPVVHYVGTIKFRPIFAEVCGLFACTEGLKGLEFVDVTDESATAEAITAQSFPALKALETSLLEAHEGPIILGATD